MSKSNIRFYEIDLLRFLAALAVVFFHYTFRGFAEGGYSPIDYELHSQFSRYGYLGVHLFFMISGFVILLSAMNRTAIQFTVSRIVRLYPAYWAGVTLTAVVIALAGAPLFSVSLPQYLANLTMLSGYVGIEHIDGVYWTLLVELKFYALIFLLLLIRRIHHIEYYMGAWLGLSLLNIVMPLPKIAAFIIFPEWAPLFISGSLFYLIHLKGLNLYRGLLLMGAYFCAIYYAIGEVAHLEEYYHSALSASVSVTLLTLFYLIFILITTNKLHWIRSPFLIKIGILTYPLYLIHQNIGFIAFNHLADSVNRYVLLYGLIAMMLLSAWLIHLWVEKPLGGWLKRNLDRLSGMLFSNAQVNKKMI